MKIRWQKYDSLIQKAIQHYWSTLSTQALKQQAGSADRGTRSSVTGGKQMDGFCELVNELMKECGLPDAHIYKQEKLDLPGYFRPSKSWDMLVVADKKLIAAIEFKSQMGPSFGNNFNNRAEEAIGTAKDIRVAYQEGAFGKKVAAPWLGWVMLLEDCPKSTAPVKPKEPHFDVFKEFKNASYAQRYELMLRRLVQEQLYSGAAFLMATKQQGRRGQFREPAEDLKMKVFLAGLAGHIGVHLASKG